MKLRYWLKKNSWSVFVPALSSTVLLGISFALYAAHSNQSVAVVGALSLSTGTATIAFDEPLQREMARLEMRLATDPQDHEASLLKGLLKFKAGYLDDALLELDQLTQRAPEFHLAHLMRGDLLIARTHTVADIGRSALLDGVGKKQQKQLALLRQEADARLHAYQAGWTDQRVPRQLLALGPSVDKALIVDKSQHRLYVFSRQGHDLPPRLVRDYYVSTGKLAGNKKARGDLRTPEGVYFITSKIPQEKLPDEYGVGAFPVNYPNELDRRLGKTGDGIWLHGTEPNYYSRPPLDSEGCVVLTNADLTALQEEITPGTTPVIIADKIEWLTPEQWRNERNSVLAALEQWRKDWESMNVERYLGHYANDFWAKGHNIKSWRKRKRYLARRKTYQKVTISDISVLAYPESATDGRELVVARFQQQYHSNNFNSAMQKRLYLRRQGKQWRIVYEGR